MLISTWGIADIHVGKENSPRGDEMKLRRNEMISPKNFFAPTWRFGILHVAIVCNSDAVRKFTCDDL